MEFQAYCTDGQFNGNVSSNRRTVEKPLWQKMDPLAVNWS